MTVEPGGRPSPAVAYLVATYPALSESFVLREVTSLRALGFRVEVASINRPDRPEEALTTVERSEAAATYYVKAHGARGAAAAHLRTVVRRPGRYWRGWRRALTLARFDLRALVFHAFYLTEALMVGEWMRRRGFGHLHTHLGAQAATVGLLVKEVNGFGWSTTIHGPDEFYDARGQNLRAKVAAADFAVCISDYARSQLMKLSAPAHWDRLEVCRLGVDPERFAPRPFRADPDPFEILCVGRLTPAKGQHVLIEAVARLHRRGHRVVVRFVGDGPDRHSLEATARRLDIKDHVVLEGGVDQDHIADHYRRADLFCLPSFAEGIPVALMEAMAMEIPCVTTHITGIPELVTDGHDGRLVAPSDTSALAEVIAELVDDPDQRLRLGRAGRQTVIERYHLGRSTEALAAIFRRRLNGGQPAAEQDQATTTEPDGQQEALR
jgi:glycosyltransferase involved in cell wall biosynthesis